jgi:DNA polymerase III epsilon subunit-like protein
MNSWFVSIDTETLGLGPKAPIIEIGAVMQNWLDPVVNPPIFHCYVLPESDVYYSCEPYAMSMHPTILRRIATHEQGYNYLRPHRVAQTFSHWLKSNPQCFKPVHSGPLGRKIVVAGKNYLGFDYPRLVQNFPRWATDVPVSHRVLDMGNLYWDPLIDEEPPNTGACMMRAGLDGAVAHTALEDAKVVAKAVIAAAQRQVQNCMR